MVLLWRAIEYEKVEEFKMLLGGRSYLVEVAEGLPLKMDGNLKIDGKNKPGSINAIGNKLLKCQYFNKLRCYYNHDH